MSDIVVAPDGTIRFVHDDGLAAAFKAEAVGPMRIDRASHVEPREDGTWEADMAPAGGPILGPFGSRGEALAAEHAWLLAEGIPACAPCAAGTREVR